MSLFAPVTRLLSGRHKSKQMAIAVLFAIPLAIAIVANPPGWNAAGFAIFFFVALALYVLAGLSVSTEGAWTHIHRVASLLNEHDLRAGEMPDEAGLDSAIVKGRGQMGRLYLALRETHDSLSRLVAQANRSATAARAAADDLAAGSVHLSQRTEEQASTLEETAAAMEELATTVAQNAENCRNASDTAAGATVVARKGSDVTQQVVANMDRIEGSSRKIVDIISVIEGIAFQTNILALNAAVEAARAGEHGRGFAVVAEEVRSLAHRSAEAARQIKALIGDSVESVGAGTRLVHEAGDMMQQVMAGVEEVNALLGVIAVASREQAGGVASVNRALVQLQGVTQQNAALVQQAAYSAVTLKEEAGQLLDVVTQFRIDEEPRGPERTPAAPRKSAPMRMLPG